MPNPNKHNNKNASSANNASKSNGEADSIRELINASQSSLEHGLNKADAYIKDTASQVGAADGKAFRAGLQQRLIDEVKLASAQSKTLELKAFLRDDIGKVAQALNANSNEADKLRLEQAEQDVIDAVVIDDDWDEFDAPVALSLGSGNSPSYSNDGGPVGRLEGGPVAGLLGSDKPETKKPKTPNKYQVELPKGQ